MHSRGKADASTHTTQPKWVSSLARGEPGAAPPRRQEPTPDDLSHCPALPELITATVASRPDQPDQAEFQGEADPSGGRKGLFFFLTAPAP